MSEFKLHRFNGYISNLYIAEYKDKLLLLDSGCKSDVDRIRLFCEQKLNRSVKDIKMAIVTHNHPDHSGGANLLRRLYNIPIAAGAGTDLWYKGFSGFIQHKIDCILAHIVRNANKKRIQAVVFKRFVKPDIILNDQESLPGFPDWQVIHVPGHTLHDIVLFNKKEGLLYSSDLIINVHNRYNLPIPVFFPHTMKRSFQKLMGLPIDTILPAHGDAIETEDADKEFAKMIDILELPPTEMAKTVHQISIFTPQVWKTWLSQLKHRFRNPT